MLKFLLPINAWMNLTSGREKTFIAIQNEIKHEKLNISILLTLKLSSPLAGLRKFLATESSLKMTEDASFCC